MRVEEGTADGAHDVAKVPAFARCAHAAPFGSFRYFASLGFIERLYSAARPLPCQRLRRHRIAGPLAHYTDSHT